MRFAATKLEGIRVVESDLLADARGYFMRVLCDHELAESGVQGRFVQASLSSNPRPGTVRGLHFQWPPSCEGKLVRCISGAVFDVMVDLRPDSGTFLQHFTLELSERNGRAVFIPAGFAHGFQVIEADARVLYHMTDYFAAPLGDGYRYDDPAFGIQWPQPVTVISDRDRDAPAFDVGRYRAEYARRLGGH